MTIESDVELAKNGDAAALDRVVRSVQDPVYGLALRFLGNVGDAEDAAQEILLKVVTHLSTFRGESKLLTWVYRVAANHLISVKRKRALVPESSFDVVAEFLDAGIDEIKRAAPTDGATPIDPVLVEEVRLTCTQGMLTALDRDHRLAFVLSDIVELSTEDGAAVLDIAPDAYRKRVSRARERLADFMRPRCGVFDGKNLCRCDRQATRAIRLGAMPGDPSLVQLARHPARAQQASRAADELIDLLDAVAVMRVHPDYVAPERVIEGVKRLLQGPVPPVH